MARNLPVLDYASLIERTGSARLIALLRVKLGFPSTVFDSAVRPVIGGYAEYVQLLPAMSSGRATQELLLVRTLVVVLRALDYRRGIILPHGAPPEVISAQMHRWTYAVFIAVLLGDIDAAMNGLAVTMRCRDRSEVHWAPLTGSMQACGALRYRVERLETTRADGETLGRLALALLNRLVPSAVLAWLTAEPEPMGELRALLAKEKTAGSNAIGALLLRARTSFGVLSTTHGLQTGLGRATDGSALSERSESENEGRNDAREPRAQPTEPGLGESRAPEPRKHPSPGSSVMRVSAPQTPTAVLSTGSGATTSRLASPEFLQDFEGSHRISHFSQNRGAGTGTTVDPGSTGESCPRLPVTLRPSVPSPRAGRFMEWLQAGLADGSLPFNEQGAAVHFVPEGMLLVVPRIFREYAVRCAEQRAGAVSLLDRGHTDLGKAIQLEVLRAGWHVRGPQGISVLSYQVMGGGKPASQLSGVVIRSPERFITPVPPVNPSLMRLPTERSGG